MIKTFEDILKKCKKYSNEDTIIYFLGEYTNNEKTPFTSNQWQKYPRHPSPQAFNSLMVNRSQKIKLTTIEIDKDKTGHFSINIPKSDVVRN